MANWFSRKDPAPEKSPGGSVIQRYAAEDFQGPQLGFTDEAAAGYSKIREEVYGRMFGEAESVSHEIVPQIPHIDVYTYHRGRKDGSKVCALVTGGMSDVAMKVPARAVDVRRVELIFYCLEPRQEYIDTLRWMAHFPHNQKTWIGWGHTVPNGNPPAPFWGTAALDTLLFMPTIVNKDATLPEQLQLDGDPVQFLWAVPITTAECNLKLAKGMDAIYDLFERNRHPHIFDPSRQSYV